MKKGCPYGTHRVVSPKGVLPQPADVVDNNMDRLYNLLAEFIYSKTIPGRLEAFVKNCKLFAEKVKAVPAVAVAKVKATALKIKETAVAKLGL